MFPIAAVSIIHYYLIKADEYEIMRIRTVPTNALCGYQEIKTS